MILRKLYHHILLVYVLQILKYRIRYRIYHNYTICEQDERKISYIYYI